MATPPAPEPAPTTDTSAGQYLTDATVFSELHADTLGRLDATVTRLSSESATKAEYRYRSLAGLRAINPAGMAGDELVASLNRLGELSPEERATLEDDLDNLKKLLGQVKRDQVRLLQIVPGTDLPADFHGTALIAVDQESAMLLDLIGFYSSPRLQWKSDTFEDFPKAFNKAEGQLAFALEAWSEATSALESMILTSWPTAGRGEAIGRPTTIDEFLHIELTDMHLKEADGLPNSVGWHPTSMSTPMAGSWLSIYNESRASKASEVGALVDSMSFTLRYENVSSVDIHSFTGTAAFYDLSDRPIVSLTLTYDAPIEVGEIAVDPDKGYEPNPLRDDDQVLMSSGRQDVKFRFEMKSIVFAGGVRIGEAQ